MPPAEFRCSGSPLSRAQSATLWCLRHDRPAGYQDRVLVRDARPTRDRLLGRASTMAISAISAALLITATARVAHAAARDSVRPLSVAAKGEHGSLRARSGKRRASLGPRSERHV